jgi:RND family efflux transporter MFP subunit
MRSISVSGLFSGTNSEQGAGDMGRGCSRHWVLLAALTLFAAGPGCSKHGTSAPSGGSDVRPAKVVLQRNVELTPVEQRALVYQVETVGMLEAEGQTDIAAGVSGVVDEVLFREGDQVSPGTLLVKIDQAKYEAEEAVARANVERAKAAMDLARDLADRGERARAVVSEEERAKTRGNLRVAEAEHRSSPATLTRAQRDLQRSQVRAPYAGRINKRMVTPGSYLEEKTPIATMADLSRIRLVGYVPETAAPVVRELLATQGARLEFNRVALTLGGLNGSAWTGTAAAVLVAKDYVASGYDPEFELMNAPGKTFLARLFYMSTVGQPETHMFEAKAEVLGWVPPTTPAAINHLKSLPKGQQSVVQAGALVASGLAGGPWPGLTGDTLRRSADKRTTIPLWPGFTAKIRFPLRSNPNALVIPEEAVRASERGFIAFVPAPQPREDGKTDWVARARTLELGFRADGWVEVRQGLRPGEQVVRRGAEALEDGTPIRFQH